MPRAEGNELLDDGFDVRRRDLRHHLLQFPVDGLGGDRLPDARWPGGGGAGEDVGEGIGGGLGFRVGFREGVGDGEGEGEERDDAEEMACEVHGGGL